MRADSEAASWAASDISTDCWRVRSAVSWVAPAPTMPTASTNNATSTSASVKP